MPRSKPAADSKITLPITAMLDMTFQLLFFFIINFRPADLEGQMAMTLAVDEEKQAHDQKAADPTKQKPADPQAGAQADLTLKVKTSGEEARRGGIQHIEIQD